LITGFQFCTCCHFSLFWCL
jgi:hypothetical protein